MSREGFDVTTRRVGRAERRVFIHARTTLNSNIATHTTYILWESPVFTLSTTDVSLSGLITQCTSSGPTAIVLFGRAKSLLLFPADVTEVKSSGTWLP